MKAIDYSKYEGATPGPWEREDLDIYANYREVFHWEPFEGGYFTNDDDYTLVVDAPYLLVACRERDEKIRRLRDKVATYIEDARYYHRQWRQQGELNLDAIQEMARLRELLSRAGLRLRQWTNGTDDPGDFQDAKRLGQELAALADIESQFAGTSLQVPTERDREDACKTGA